MKPPTIFSWKAVALAPLAVPALAALVSTTLGGSPLLAFLFTFVAAAFISYGASLFVLLPCLWLVSRFTELTARLVCVTGTVLGLLVYFPVGWVNHGASGNDSGPPSDTFAEYLLHQGPAEAWPFVASGLVTALAYWFLTRPRNPPVAVSQA